VGFFSWFKSGDGKKKKKVIDVTKRFDLRPRTGQGSMSKVHQAFDRDLGRTVCLKILDKEKTANFEGRFKGLNKPTEGEVCMMLRHENIVQTFETGVTTKGEPYLIMEGYLKRTSQGRVATELSYKKLGLKIGGSKQPGLL